MINFKIIPERQRIALLRDGHPCRLLGPGIVFMLKLHGRRFLPISIGDCCELMPSGQARFCDAHLPVELLGPTKSNILQVTGFHSNTIFVAGEDAGVLSDAPLPTKKAIPHYTKKGFWIGLPVVLFFAVITWMGVFYAANQIFTERIVYQRGVLTTGTVEEKILYHQIEEGEQAHYVTYKFLTPTNLTIYNKIRIEPIVWNHLKDHGPIAIRYVPDKPEMNLPDGWHMINFYCWAGGVALVGALFFSVVLIGMLIKKLSGGYA
jgi:hypothetical protein